jgi:hypothetical protein
MNPLRIATCLFALLALSACVERSAMQGGCIEHRQTDFGNQTYWSSCPAHTPNSPWRGPTAGR